MNRGFVRIGKWFVKPYQKEEKTINKRYVPASQWQTEKLNKMPYILRLKAGTQLMVRSQVIAGVHTVQIGTLYLYLWLLCLNNNIAMPYRAICCSDFFLFNRNTLLVFYNKKEETMLTR